VREALLGLALFTMACGANEAEGGQPRPDPAPAPEAADPDTADPDTVEPDEVPVEEPEPEPEEPPEPEPIDIEAGARLGPIRIGMSTDEVRALGLEESEVDPRTTAFGPYHVSYDDGTVDEISAQIGALGRIRLGDRVIEAGTHIHAIRDAFGDCTWTEGGGERYECHDGTLFVRTTHTMDPQRYTVGVAAR